MAAVSAMGTKKRVPASSERAVQKRLRFGNTTVTHDVNTRLARVKAACNAVFHTNELLLQILHALDVASLLAMSATNTSIKALIETTPSLLTHLFLQATPKLDRTHWILDTTTKRIRAYSQGEEQLRSYDWCSRQTIITIATPNPLLFKRQKTQIHNVETRFRLCETLRFTLRPTLQLPARHPHSLAFVSAVHRMYLCQPPVYWAEVNYSYRRVSDKGDGDGENLERKRIVIENEKGVRFGHVVEAFVLAAGEVECRLRVAKCAVWLKGVVFASQEEREVVEGSARGVVVKGRKLVPV